MHLFFSAKTWSSKLSLLCSPLKAAIGEVQTDTRNVGNHRRLGVEEIRHTLLTSTQANRLADSGRYPGTHQHT